MQTQTTNIQVPWDNPHGAKTPGPAQPDAGNRTKLSREVQTDRIKQLPEGSGIETERCNNRVENDTTASAYDWLPRPIKYNSKAREDQTDRCILRNGKQGSAHETLPKKESVKTAAKRDPKIGSRNTSQTDSFWSGVSERSGSSSKQKHKQRYYDPLIGNHVIPIIRNHDLLERIADRDNLLQAIAFLARHKEKTPGPDHKSVEETCIMLSDPENLERLRQQLLQETYRPGNVQSTQIPKSNGKTRPLKIATVMDRCVQRAILQQVITNLPKNPWCPYSFAYHHGQNTTDAIEEVNRIREEGYKYAIELDLESFFDNVRHTRLLKKLRRHIADKRVVRMISHIISALIINNHGELTKNRKGTPQGFAISSWLAADLYLDEIDQEMTRRNLRFVRFADDITIFTRSKKSAKRVKARIIKFAENVMECPVNKKKTRIVTIENVSLLGVELRDGHWRILREKVRNHCGEYLDDIAEYKRTKNEFFLYKAAQRMQGFIGGYTRIPDICLRQIRALRRWCMNKWWATGERKLFFAQKRWMVPD